MLEDGLAGIGEPPFDEEACVKRFAHYIARQAGVTAVNVEPSIEGSALNDLAAVPPGQPLAVPGRPLVRLVPKK
jgi:hypothetical protein